MTLPSSSLDTTSGCLSGVLRRLLCPTTTPPPPPTNPPPPPSIVARLMGLDSMPVPPYAPPPPPEKPILRSRSTNSFVLLTSDPLVLATKTQRSLSFREAPTYLRRENDDFLLLSFDPNDDGGVAPQPEPDLVLGPQAASIKRRKRRDCTSVVYNNVEDEKSSVRRKRRAKHGHGSRRKVEVECSSSSSSSFSSSSQDSSPVSVLDRHWDVGAEMSAAASPDISVSEHKDSKRKPRDSVGRKLPPDLEDRHDTSLSIHRLRISEDGGKRELEQDKRKREAERDWHEFSCRLAGEDVKMSSWVPQRMQEFDVVRELSAEIGLDLLESLLYEVMDVAEF